MKTKTISVDLMSATNRFIKTLKVSVPFVAEFVNCKPTWVLTYDNIISAIKQSTKIKYHHIAFNNMKRVSFKVAQAIKDAGYPQICDKYYALFDDESNIDIWQTEPVNHISLGIKGESYACPYIMAVWIWLWREKHITISSQLWYDGIDKWGIILEGSTFYEEIYEYNDPEEAIATAIEHLVDNDLIK